MHFKEKNKRWHQLGDTNPCEVTTYISNFVYIGYVSIESDLVKDIDFDEQIYKFAAIKARKSKF